MAEFKHFDLGIVSPAFDSPLTDLIIELDYLRKKQLYGTTPPVIFFQLKHIFHMLESIASARIEGNNTTIAEYIETKISPKPPADDVIKEIQNMEACLQFIDTTINGIKIDRAFISQLHKMAVKDLPAPPRGEGDESPGQFRSKQVRIENSPLILPEPIAIPAYMDELFRFIEADDEPKYDLLKIALAHHRFVWIHPFNNGNGRTVRLLTYAMMIKYGFNIREGRILNPAAVFCNNREGYYDNLALADSGVPEKLLLWSEYVLKGLKQEIEKIDRLLNYDFLKDNILLPAISHSLERKYITDIEFRVLKRVTEKKIVKASDLSDILTATHLSERSRSIGRLKMKKMLMTTKDDGRKYVLCFSNNYLLRGVIKALDDQGFLPVKQ